MPTGSIFAPFLLGYALHLAIGLLLSAVLWLAALGAMRLADRRCSLAPADRLAFGYPLALVLLVAACFAALLHWLAGAVGIVAVLGAAWAGWRDRGAVLAAVPNLQPALGWVLPPAAAIAFVLGLLNRGPSATLGASPLADVVWWAERIANLAAQPMPPRDLLIEGFRYGYAQQGFGMIGAALAWLPGFDGFLFDAVSGQVVLALNLAVVLALLARPDQAAERAAAWTLAILLLLGAPVHPSWTVQSVTVALTHPLFLLAYRAAGGLRLPWHGALGAIVALCAASYVSKIASVGLLVLPFAWRLWQDAEARLAPHRRLAAAIATAVLLAAYAAAMLWIYRWDLSVFRTGYLPFATTTQDFLRGEVSGVRLVAAYARDLGAILMLAWVWRSGPPLLAVTVTSGVAGLCAWPSLLPITLMGAIAMVAYRLVERPDLARRDRWLLLVAAPCEVLHGALLEYNSPHTTLAILALQAGVLAAPLLAAARRVVLLRRAASLAAGLVVAGGLTLMFADRWFLATVARNWSMPLSSAAFDIWREVGRRTPPDALLFTDQTGEALTLDQALNFYPGISGRQIYLAGWNASPLRSSHAERTRRLADNAAVLDGRRRPADLALSRPYGAYFAVVRAQHQAAEGWRELYRNAAFALYAIAP